MPANLLAPSRGIRLTERDRLLLTFAAEHRLVLARQLEALARTGRGQLVRRLDTLVAAGYLHVHQVFDEPYYQIRSIGLSAIDSQLPAPRFKLADYKHDVGVAWLWLAAHRGTFGSLREVLSERQLRSHDGALDHPHDPYGVRLGGVDRYGNERLHYPDLLLVDPRGRRLALELELTPKGPQKRERILGGYAADHRIDGVLYLVEDERRGRGIRRLVEGTARDMGLSDRVRFQFVKPYYAMAHEPRRPLQRAVSRKPAEVTR